MRRALTIVSLAGALIGAIGIVAVVFLLAGGKFFSITTSLVTAIASITTTGLLLYEKMRENQIRIESNSVIASRFAGSRIGGSYESVVIRNGSSLPIRVKGLYVLIRIPCRSKGKEIVFDFYKSIETLIWEGYINGEHNCNAGSFKNARVEPLTRKEINLNKTLSKNILQSAIPSLEGTTFYWRVLMDTSRGIYISGEDALFIRLLFPLGISALRNILKLIGEVRGYQVELIKVQEGFWKTDAIESPWGLMAMAFKDNKLGE